jgi:single-strand DNA-binding protein
MKNITILGGLGKDPVTRTTGNGNKVTGFSIGVDDGFGDNKRTIWFDVSFWGKRGDVIAQHVKKGDKLCVSGELSTREYEGKTYLTLNGNDFSFAGSKGGSGNSGGGSGGYGSGSAPAGGAGDMDQDIPFHMSWK